MLTVIVHWGAINRYIHIIKWPKGLKKDQKHMNKRGRMHISNDDVVCKRIELAGH